MDRQTNNTARRHEDDLRARLTDGLHRAADRLGLEHHAGATAVWRVVDHGMASGRVVAELVKLKTGAMRE